MIRRRWIVVALVAASATAAFAHPLGNFSVNRWAGLEAGPASLRIHYAVDFAEIPTLQEAAEGVPHAEELAARLRDGLGVKADGRALTLVAGESAVSFAPGAGGLRTMRFEATYDAPLPPGGGRIAFRDDNFAGRVGWREVIAWGGDGASVVSSSVPDRDRSARLTSYPQDLLQAPPRVEAADFRVVGGSNAREAGTAIASAPGKRAAAGFASLIDPDKPLGFGLVLAALGAAIFWGGAHALSPGHGKTVVAAYLVGQRGAPRHAVWLGLIVTFTHTVGVFALGGLTLVLSRYFVPDALYPWLGFASGAIVAVMGAGLLVRRLRPGAGHGRSHHHHDGHSHSHVVPEKLSFRGLLALGISGGIVPCPSALVVLLSAIAFHRVLFGMALIAAFSAGLAGVLVAVGLTMVYARSVFDRFDAGGRVTRRLGQISAAAILIAGVAIMLKSVPAPSAAISATALGVLGLGLLFGLRHATEADHIAAVGAIVSERRGWPDAVRTGALWGAGHTVSILAAGALVLGANVVIPEPVARVLELGVALMIIALGGTALARALRSRADAHVHVHAHGSLEHRHLHFHEPEDQHVHGLVPAGHDHAMRGIGMKPLAVGMMHGLAGSAALTLLVLAQIRSTPLGIAYLLVFGLGSIGGMALMSLMISLPFSATVAHPGLNRGIRVAAGFLSLAFGLFYAWAQIAA